MTCQRNGKATGRKGGGRLAWIDNLFTDRRFSVIFRAALEREVLRDPDVTPTADPLESFRSDVCIDRALFVDEVLCPLGGVPFWLDAADRSHETETDLDLGLDARFRTVRRDAQDEQFDARRERGRRSARTRQERGVRVRLVRDQLRHLDRLARDEVDSSSRRDVSRRRLGRGRVRVA